MLRVQNIVNQQDAIEGCRYLSSPTRDAPCLINRTWVVHLWGVLKTLISTDLKSNKYVN